MPIETSEILKTGSVPEVGHRYFGLSRGAAYAAVRRGDIPAIRIGKLWRVPIAAVERMLDEVSRNPEGPP
jgi:excisionase family DNA binding protein